jgi:hypothetical protein
MSNNFSNIITKQLPKIFFDLFISIQKKSILNQHYTKIIIDEIDTKNYLNIPDAQRLYPLQILLLNMS